LSVGQAQRILLALAVLHRPALLIADEPSSALDPLTQGDLLELLKRLNRERGMARTPHRVRPCGGNLPPPVAPLHALAGRGPAGPRVLINPLDLK